MFIVFLGLHVPRSTSNVGSRASRSSFQQQPSGFCCSCTHPGILRKGIYVLQGKGSKLFDCNVLHQSALTAAHCYFCRGGRVTTVLDFFWIHFKFKSDHSRSAYFFFCVSSLMLTTILFVHTIVWLHLSIEDSLW